jgi:hypothetical protein
LNVVEVLEKMYSVLLDYSQINGRRIIFSSFMQKVKLGLASRNGYDNGRKLKTKQVPF